MTLITIMAHKTAENQEILDKLRYVNVLKPRSPFGSSSYDENKHEDRVVTEAIRDAIGYILESRSKQTAVWEVFKAAISSRKVLVEVNSYTGDLMVNRLPYSVGKLYKRLCEVFEVVGLLPFSTFEMFLADELEHRTFNPVAHYLDKCSQAHPEPWEGWDTLAKDVFGTEDPLSQEMLTAFLIGAVNRAIEPGCIMRQCLVLQGNQEVGKSQFIRRLFGADLYASRDSEMSDADVYRQLQHCWVMELEEMEAIASKRSVENLKRFISVQEDEYRDLYVNKPRKRPRKAVMVGTVNSSEFLRDETGNSLFWVIPIPGEVNLAYVETRRDLIWAEAHRRYQSGEQWWSKELSRKAQARASEFQVANSWDEPVEALITNIQTEVSPKHQEGLFDVAFKASDILSALGVRVADHAKHTKKLAQSLQSLGYEKKSIKAGGRAMKLYAKPETDPIAVQFSLSNMRWGKMA